MQVVGEGKDLWRLEIVLWVREPGAGRVQELIDRVMAATVSSGGEDERVLDMGDVEPAFSYDIQPPEGGVGVACWVRADSVGGAAEKGWSIVRDAATAVLGAEPRLWDLRVIPRGAILIVPEGSA